MPNSTCLVLVKYWPRLGAALSRAHASSGVKLMLHHVFYLHISQESPLPTGIPAWAVDPCHLRPRPAQGRRSFRRLRLDQRLGGNGRSHHHWPPFQGNRSHVPQCRNLSRSDVSSSVHSSRDIPMETGQPSATKSMRMKIPRCPHQLRGWVGAVGQTFFSHQTLPWRRRRSGITRRG